MALTCGYVYGIGLWLRNLALGYGYGLELWVWLSVKLMSRAMGVGMA